MDQETKKLWADAVDLDMQVFDILGAMDKGASVTAQHAQHASHLSHTAMGRLHPFADLCMLHTHANVPSESSFSYQAQNPCSTLRPSMSKDDCGLMARPAVLGMTSVFPIDLDPEVPVQSRQGRLAGSLAEEIKLESGRARADSALGISDQANQRRRLTTVYNGASIGEAVQTSSRPSRASRRNNGPLAMVCDVCNMLCESRSKVIEHVKNVHRVMPFQCHFKGCAKQFSIKDARRDHIRCDHIQDLIVEDQARRFWHLSRTNAELTAMSQMPNFIPSNKSKVTSEECVQRLRDGKWILTNGVLERGGRGSP